MNGLRMARDSRVEIYEWPVQGREWHENDPRMVHGIHGMEFMESIVWNPCHGWPVNGILRFVCLTLATHVKLAAASELTVQRLSKALFKPLWHKVYASILQTSSRTSH